MDELIAKCDLEPVRYIGAVQKFGGLIICDPSTLRVKQISENTPTLLGLAPSELLGQSLGDIFALPSLNAPYVSFSERGKQIFTYERAGYRYFEIEPTPTSDAGALSNQLRSALDSIHNQNNWQQFLAEGVRQVQAISGFDRVMIYRFHEDNHGEVVAEAVRPGVESYMGLHYPASDIPAPARETFLHNWVRIIPDITAPAEPLVGERLPGNDPSDLGQTLVRAVSPIHLVYLKNMRVAASLTLSIISEGKLWGLVACHHLTPRYIDGHVRAACETVARILSTSLRNVEVHVESAERERQRNFLKIIANRIAVAEDIGREVMSIPSILDLIECDGAAASLYIDGMWETSGKVPNSAQLADLITWLSHEHPNEEVFATHELASVYPAANEFKSIGAGLLAIAIPKTRRNYILLFRPEIMETVRWAGKPNEKNTDSQGKLSPRASFAEWAEQVAGKSKPWAAWDIDAAHDLRAAILGSDLHKQFLKEQASRQEAERAMRSREELMAVLSHDLKNPIGSIQLQANLLERKFKTSDLKIVEAAGRISRAAQNMNSLINDILHVTSMEAGKLNIEKSPESIRAVVEDTLDLLSFLATNNSLTLKIEDGAEDCVAPIDRERIGQVLSNLVGNALKFTPAGGQITIGFHKAPPDRVAISVADTGPGIPTEHLVHVFDRFWQANQAKRLGTGLGLAICKGIIEGHGGDIWAENRASGGTVFKLTLPLG